MAKIIDLENVNKLTHGTEWKSTNCRLCLRNDEAGVISGGGDECKEDEY